MEEDTTDTGKTCSSSTSRSFITPTEGGSLGIPITDRVLGATEPTTTTEPSHATTSDGVASELLGDLGAEFLPDDLKWVYLHPGLPYPSDEDAAPKVRRTIAAYEKKSPPPNQGARNMYISMRGDQKAMQTFFANVSRHYFESKKLGDTETEKEEAQLIKSAEGLRTRLKKRQRDGPRKKRVSEETEDTTG